MLIMVLRVVLSVAFLATATSVLADATQIKIQDALNLLYELDSSRSSTDQEIQSLSDRVLALEQKMGYAEPDDIDPIYCDEDPHAPQAAYDAGATRIVVERRYPGTGEDRPCAELIVDRQPVVIVGGGIKLPFSRIVVRNSAAVLLDIGVEELEVFASRFTLSDSSAERAQIENSSLRVAESLIADGLIVGTRISAQTTNSFVNVTLRRSEIARIANSDANFIGSRIKLEVGSYIDATYDSGFGPLRFSSSTLICDPLTTRIYDPAGTIFSPIEFQPPQVAAESCLIQHPYQ